MQIPNRKKTIFLTGSAKVAVAGATKTTSHRCLDAAHGKTVNPIVARERPRQIGLSPETARTDLITGKCGRGPTTPGHADAFQGSRVTETVARSRHKEQSLKRLRRKVRNNGFTTKVDAFTSSGISDAACGARLRASAAGGCGPHGSKNPTTATTKSSARAGCGEGRACGREPAPDARQILHFVQNDKKTRSDTRQQNCKHPTVIPRRDNKRPPPTRKRPRKKKAAGKSKQKTTTNRKRAKTIKKNRKTSDTPPRTPPESKKSATKKREPPNGDSLKSAAERPTRGSDRK